MYGFFWAALIPSIIGAVGSVASKPKQQQYIQQPQQGFTKDNMMFIAIVGFLLIGILSVVSLAGGGSTVLVSGGKQ